MVRAPGVAVVKVNTGGAVKRRGGYKRRRRSSGGGFGGGWIPPKDDLYDMAGAAAYGKLESLARANDSSVSFLSSVPFPVPSIGFSGHIALYLWVLSKLRMVPANIRKVARHGAKGTMDVWAYQLAAKGGLFDAPDEKFQLSGLHPFAASSDVSEAELAGIEFDPATVDAGAHT